VLSTHVNVNISYRFVDSNPNYGFSRITVWGWSGLAFWVRGQQLHHSLASPLQLRN